MTQEVDASRPAIAGAVTVLCVDDEGNILSALRRLLRPCGYTVLTAESGAAALAILETTAVDLVLSDMRMPEMNGADFLHEVKGRWPDTMRILLTGHADLDSTISAINDAAIYRYIAKPWDDPTLVRAIADAVELKFLKHERDELQALTAQQNVELSDLNDTLEQKVRERTAELDKALAALQASHATLKKSFFTSVKVFSNLIELREGAAAGHSRQVAETARRIGRSMKLGDAALQDITLAGLMHGIGEIGIPDALLRKPPHMLTPEEQTTIRKIPGKAQGALMALDQLAEAGKAIRAYRERYDGYGYPDRLSGWAIPVSARILSVAHDYEAAQDGMLTGSWLSKLEAREHLMAGRGKRYDPEVVDAFLLYLESTGVAPRAELVIPAANLKPGMCLSRDLVAADGILLLSKGAILDADRIEQLGKFERGEGGEFNVCIRAPQPPVANKPPVAPVFA